MFDTIFIILRSINYGYRKRGFLNLSLMIWAALVDELDDVLRGFIKAPYLDPAKEAPEKKNSMYGNYYQPIRARPFLKVLNQLQPRKDVGFFDIGAGTGKALFLAADYGFTRVAGVEIVDSLCSIAKKNISQQSPKYRDSHFRMICGDVTTTGWDKNDGFFLMNDPFSEEVFSLVVDRLITHNNSTLIPVTVLYKNNNMRKIPSLERLRPLCEYQEIDICANFYQVYQFRKEKSSAQ